MSESNSTRISSAVAAQREYFKTGATLPLEFRRRQLKALESALKKHEPKIMEALWTDLHKSAREAYITETALVYGEIRSAVKNLSRWARPRRVRSPLSVRPSKSYILREPLGCSLIVAPWNYPVQLLLNPLVGAIVAGCTAVLKPSPYVPNVSEALSEMISETFPPEYITIFLGGRDVNELLFSERYDIAFLTGSPHLGRVMAEAQAKYLTPLVLELGGKSPCIVDKDADIALAARRIAWGKCVNAGQTCIAPDYLLLHRDVKDRFIEAFGEAMAELYPDGTRGDENYVRMVRKEAYERVMGYLADGKTVYGGGHDPEALWIEPTILDGADPGSPVMQEEIFGPVLPVITVSSADEAVDFINAREKPLALYYFGGRATAKDVLARTSSGGACVNDVLMHFTNPRMPFGGVGNSGMGSYHGERSFLAFSHERAVAASPTWIDLPFRYMPYKWFGLIKKIL